MVRNSWRRLSGVPLQRPIVVLALAAGVVFLAVRLIERAPFFVAFTQAGVVAFVLMAVLATARALWRGDDLEEAEAGGVRMRFSAAHKAVDALARRVDARARATDERLLDLEREVFKDDGTG
ncbi:MAG: hypothetical protein QOI48_3733 [Solirubrobacteraceae bacterium]|jgi:hypothetical protein|nr:hypothetical protein [Solirubrobacteraceae bacterium]